MLGLNSGKIKELLIEIATLYQEKRDELSKYDLVIGDGDHGISMARAAKAAYGKVIGMDDNEPINEYFKVYGRTLISEIGGAMGPLFGSIFTELGKASKGKDSFTAEDFAEGIIGATKKVMALGGAKVGDKTMVDAMFPTAEALEKALEEGKNLEEITTIAQEVSWKGVKSTIPLKAKKGRSKFLQEKAIGYQDAGATSFYYLMKKFNEFVLKQDEV